MSGVHRLAWAPWAPLPSLRVYNCQATQQPSEFSLRSASPAQPGPHSLPAGHTWLMPERVRPRVPPHQQPRKVCCAAQIERGDAVPGGNGGLGDESVAGEVQEGNNGALSLRGHLELVEEAKASLWAAVAGTNAGADAADCQRAEVEEAVLFVERNGGAHLPFALLDGTWDLVYTTAPDVLVLLRSPLLQIGRIGQLFTCSPDADNGQLENIVRFGLPLLLQEQDGATLTVRSNFRRVSSQTLIISFEEAVIDSVRISEVIQAAIAPAVLPRTFGSMQLLQALTSLHLRLPLSSAPTAAQISRTPLGMAYLLTYLDKDLLLGRSLGQNGLFVFRRRPRA